MIFNMGTTVAINESFCYRCKGFGSFWTASLQFEGALKKEYATGSCTVLHSPSLSVYDSTSRHTFTSLPESGPFRSIWIIFSEPRIDIKRLRLDAEAPGAWSISLRESPLKTIIESIFHEMLGHWRSRSPFSAELTENALERIFLLIADNRVERGKWVDYRIKNTMAYMREHLNARMDIASLAKRVNLSASRLSHLFAEMNQCTPMEYLEQVRMDEAKSLLMMSQHSVAQIAACLGYENQFYFSNRFRKRFGVSPLQFRKASMF